GTDGLERALAPNARQSGDRWLVTCGSQSARETPKTRVRVARALDGCEPWLVLPAEFLFRERCLLLVTVADAFGEARLEQHRFLQVAAQLRFTLRHRSLPPADMRNDNQRPTSDAAAAACERQHRASALIPSRRSYRIRPAPGCTPTRSP